MARDRTGPRRRKPRTGYLIFCKFYESTIEREHPGVSPQEKKRICGKEWRKLPNELKNSFIIFANDERRPSADPTTITQLPPSSGGNELQVIFDDHSSIVTSNKNSSGELSSSSENNNSPVDIPLSEYQRYFHGFE